MRCSPRSPMRSSIAALEPFDVARFPQARTVLCTFGDDATTFEALAAVLAGRAVPRGRLPVRVRVKAEAIVAPRAARASPPPCCASNAKGASCSSARSALDDGGSALDGRDHALRSGFAHESLRRGGGALRRRRRAARTRRAAPRVRARMARTAHAPITLRMMLAHTSGMDSGADYRTLFGENVENFALRGRSRRAGRARDL
jgi:hypothetical protein